jgi:hypothetical protein
MRTASLLLLALSSCATLRSGEPRFDGQRARADVAWLSDAARTGRGAGTPGLAASADWVEARFVSLGLAPAGVEGYRQPLEVPTGATLLDGNGLRLGARTLGLQTDFVPFGFSDDGKVEAEVVFVGYGITAPELSYDDYAGLEVKGKVVLVAADFASERDAASPFRDPAAYRYAEWRYKVTNARDHGAAAVLAVRDDWNHPGADELPPWRGNPGSRAGVPGARVTLAALKQAGIDVAALALAMNGKPASRALGVTAALSVAIHHDKAEASNVVAILPGSDPVLAKECVVVGAHYDHLGLGGEASAAPDQYGQVHPGADDNASGTAAMLEVARAFVGRPAPKRSVVFVAFAGEELGVLGSAVYAKAPPAACPLERTQVMINLDMVGRPTGAKLYVYGVDTARGLRERVAALVERPPRLELKAELAGTGFGASDQTSFYSRDVPVLFLFNGAHLDYHRPTDTVDKIDPHALAESARLGWRAAMELANTPTRLEVVRAAAPAPAGGRGGQRPWLGTIPDFSERAEAGVAITGVMPGSPAEKAGLTAGDVLLRVGDKKLLNLQDMQYALASRRPGDVVEVEYSRGGEVTVLTLTLAERR